MEDKKEVIISESCTEGRLRVVAVPIAIQTVNRIHVLISSCIMRYMLTKILNKGNQGSRGTFRRQKCGKQMSPKEVANNHGNFYANGTSVLVTEEHKLP